MRNEIRQVVTSGLFFHWCGRKEEERFAWSTLCRWREDDIQKLGEF